MRKVLLSIILAIVLILGISPIGAIAEEGFMDWGFMHEDDVQEAEPNYFYVENATNMAGTVTWSFVSGENDSPTLEYSTDGKQWNDVTIGTAIDIPANGKIYFCGDNPGGLSSSEYKCIYISGSVQHNVGGDVTTLMNKSGNVTTITSVGAFFGLFRDDTNLVDASELILPATKISEYCYSQMFWGCSSLTAAPALPAEELAAMCYEYMFYLCENLAAAPALPATKLAEECYNVMFKNCTSLILAPDLPARVLATRCYNGMFSGCENLTTAPDLPATELAEECYRGMFYDCKNLTAAPTLPATELAKGCYWQIFYGCENVRSVTVGFTEFGVDNETYKWLNGTADEGTLYVPMNFVESFNKSENTVPEGWTVATAMIPAHKHIYGAATYIWNDALTTCTAYHTCTYADCDYIELETVDVVKDEEKITATFAKAEFANQTKMLADVTPQFYISCYTEDGKCLMIGTPEKDGEALKMTVPYTVFQETNSAKLFTVNSSYEPLKPERTISK